MTQNESNRTQHGYSKRQRKYSTKQHELKHNPTVVQRKLGQQKYASSSQLFLLNYLFPEFLLEIGSLVLHVILFQSFIPRAYYTSFRNARQPRTYEVLHRFKRSTGYQP